MWTPGAAEYSKQLSRFLLQTIGQHWVAPTRPIDRIAETAMYSSPEAFVTATEPAPFAARYIFWLHVDAKQHKVCLAVNESTGEAAYVTVGLPRTLFAPPTVATGFVDHECKLLLLDAVVVLAGAALQPPLDWLDALLVLKVQLPPTQQTRPDVYGVDVVQYEPFTRFVVKQHMYMRQRQVGLSVPLIRVDEEEEYEPVAMTTTTTTTNSNRKQFIHPERAQRMRAR
jgi:hypothetical protein